ncbi:MAG: PASTA domain-containing protein [Oscillospiraceae bacterium]|nr:PASTA domain-containing protein [Oscillospiraceae bacterium]
MEGGNRGNDKDKVRHVSPDRKANRTILLRTLLLLVMFGILTFIPLFGKLYAIQIRDHEMYQEKAIGQQTMDNAVSANRGQILDSNGKVLAMSATVYDVILSPNDFRKLQNNWDERYGKKPEGAKYPRPEVGDVSAGLAEILGLDPQKVQERMEKNTYYEVAATRIETEVADDLRQYITDKHLSNSVLLVPTTKRYYPYSSLAAQVIGWVNWKNDNKGAYGMEALYEEDLAGKTGRVVTAKDGDGKEMKYSFQDYYDASDGNTLHLTVDATIQYYCERVLEKGIEMFDVQNGGFVIAMDPKTGAIKAWANSPNYDLNTPWTITDPVLSEYLETVKNDPTAIESAYNEALGQAQNRQWRNKAMNDSYEPGSTFKSMVLAAALEEGVVNENSTFYCPGYYVVGNDSISCSQKAPGHGSQNLAKAVANSCNPAFMMIGQALGAEKFYNYLEDFGFLEKTGIDMQGEGNSIVWPRSTFVAPSTQQNTYLATASFGQGFQATPIQLITAASAVINGGHLMKPYVMESITAPDGTIIQQTEPTEVRQVISEETSARCRTILEGVVNGGTGKRAYVPGYRIGGKTGSSETVESRRGEDRTIVSFLGFAPADDPQIVVLLAYDAPKRSSSGSKLTSRGYYISGGNMAAVMAGELLSDILGDMGVEKVYTEAERAKIDMVVPNVVDQTAQIGQEAIQNSGFSVRTVGEGNVVTDQIPAGGAVIPSGSQVVLYLGEEKPADLVDVPDVRGKTAAQAQEILGQYGLYLKVSGSSSYMSSDAVVASQTIWVGTSVERGTVVECIFSDNTMVD